MSQSAPIWQQLLAALRSCQQARQRFTDCVVLVTGGTSGIGLATAIEFARGGAAHVVVCGRTQRKWQLAQQHIHRILGGETETIEYYPCDVRVQSQVQVMIQSVFDRYGRLDVCFNNAGVQPTGSGDLTQENFQSFVDESDGSIVFRLPASKCAPDCLPSQQTPVSASCESPIATTALGVFYCMKHELDAIYRRQPAQLPVAIVNTISRNALLPSPDRPLYDASKAFVWALSRAMATQVLQRCRELGRAPIRINTVAPGPIDTPLERATYHYHPGPGGEQQYLERARQGVPMQRIGQPIEIANTVLFLADPQLASYITGTNLSVDGGYTGSPVVG